MASRMNPAIAAYGGSRTSAMNTKRFYRCGCECHAPFRPPNNPPRRARRTFQPGAPKPPIRTEWSRVADQSFVRRDPIPPVFHPHAPLPLYCAILSHFFFVNPNLSVTWKNHLSTLRNPVLILRNPVLTPRKSVFLFQESVFILRESLYSIRNLDSLFQEHVYILREPVFVLHKSVHTTQKSRDILRKSVFPPGSRS